MAGVLSTRVGYTGGSNPAPTYHSVCKGDGHYEAIRVEFDPAVISYSQLLQSTFLSRGHAPKAKRQYASAVFVHDEAQKSAAVRALKAAGMEHAVTVTDATEWHDAEEYHQKYYARAAGGLACPRPRH